MLLAANGCLRSMSDIKESWLRRSTATSSTRARFFHGSEQDSSLRSRSRNTNNRDHFEFLISVLRFTDTCGSKEACDLRVEDEWAASEVGMKGGRLGEMGLRRYVCCAL
jgi:hypothetical protein